MEGRQVMGNYLESDNKDVMNDEGVDGRSKNQAKQARKGQERASKSLKQCLDGLPATSLSQQDYIKNINRVCLGNHPQKKRIEGLMKAWKEMNLAHVLDKSHLTHQTKQLYRKVPVLSARVLKTFQFLISDKCSRQIKETMPEITAFTGYLRENKLQMSLNESFWQEKTYSYSRHYMYSSFRREEPKQTKGVNHLRKVAQWINESKIESLKQLHSLMVEIGLIKITSTVKENVFALRLNRISEKEQREMYLRDMCFPLYEQIQEFQKGQLSLPKLQRNLQIYYPNYCFYTGIHSRRQTITDVHRMEGDYRRLEGRHDYIQWMFPNHYGSGFNAEAKPLNYAESALFYHFRQLGTKILLSLHVFMDFMGIRFTLPDGFQVISPKRLKDVILVYHHNHLRIMRILACLSVVGFREIALNIVDFLDKMTRKNRLLEKERSNFERQWLVYGDQEGNKAKKMCFLEETEFPAPHQILSEIQTPTAVIGVNQPKKLLIKLPMQEEKSEAMEEEKKQSKQQ